MINYCLVLGWTLLLLRLFYPEKIYWLIGCVGGAGTAYSSYHYSGGPSPSQTLLLLKEPGEDRSVQLSLKDEQSHDLTPRISFSCEYAYPVGPIIAH